MIRDHLTKADVAVIIGIVTAAILLGILALVLLR